MKTTIFYLSFLLFMVGFCKAQSTLQFNQVLLVTSATTTVPSGKVWKVESYILNNNNSASDGTARCTGSSNYVQTYLYVNGNTFFIKPTTSNGTSSGQWGFGVTFPLWLPAGTTLATNCSTWYLSIIEFNVVP